MKKTKIIYYVFTCILSVMLLGGAYTELSGAQQAKDLFTHLGYPLYLLNILGVAKILGVIGIWQKKVTFLREWAYAGIMIDLFGALSSHLMVGDGPEVFGAAVVGIILTLGSYIFLGKLNKNNTEAVQGSLS